MIRFAIVGSGWRSLYYVRVANAMPETFTLCAMLCRTQQKADAMRQAYGIHTTTSAGEIERLKPDFIVSAVNRESMAQTCAAWLDKGFAVLAETPLALTKEDIHEMWRRYQAGQRIQVAEQYFMRPDYAGIIRTVQSGLIGEPVSATVSAMHDYHAVSMIRHLLCLGTEDVAVTGKRFVLPVANTKTRYETLTDGKICMKEQDHLILEFAGGKAAFYDFLSEQYRSTIRSRYLNVRGTRGEIVNQTVYYLDENNLGRKKRCPMPNPVRRYGLKEDEAAIAQFLLGMQRYLTDGTEVYPMREALEDDYISVLMQKAAAEPYKTYRSAPRPWAETKGR